MNVKWLIKKSLRDNLILNKIIRNMIYWVHNHFMRVNGLVAAYRVYGIVKLSINNSYFKIFCMADDHIANELFYRNGYEREVFLLLSKVILESKCFIDVGANTGVFSIYAAITNPRIKVICFEPHPANFYRLKKNIVINAADNIHPYCAALGSVVGNIEMTIPKDFSISTITSVNDDFTRNFHNQDYTRIDVNQTTIDKVLEEEVITEEDIIKIDVEYYELEVLRGAELTLMNKRPMVIIELLQYENIIQQFPGMSEKINKSHATEILSYFSNLSYQGYSIEYDGLRHINSLIQNKTLNYFFVPIESIERLYSHYNIKVI